MTPLASIRAANLTAGANLSYRHVAVFVGGTGGIGAGMAQAFARHRNGDAQIILIGRNRAAAEEVIASFPKPNGQDVQYEFIECDVTLMRNVRKTTSELMQRLPKVNFLILTQGKLTTKGRDETDEGIDSKLALHYYSRWRFTYDLLPLLQKARDAGEDAKVMTVLSAGRDAGPINLDDLGLKKTFTLANAARSTSTYNDLMIKAFAERNPSISFTHIAPGIVRTNLLQREGDWILTALRPVTALLSYAVGRSPEDCAAYMWHALYSAEEGVNRRNDRGVDVGNTRLFTSEESLKALWEHSLKETSPKDSL